MSLRHEINDQLLFDSPWTEDPNDPFSATRVSVGLALENSSAEWQRYPSILLRFKQGAK